MKASAIRYIRAMPYTTASGVIVANSQGSGNSVFFRFTVRVAFRSMRLRCLSRPARLKIYSQIVRHRPNRVQEAMVSKTQKATVIPKSNREEARHSVRSSAVGKSKFQPATWIAVKSNVAKHNRYSCAPYGFVGKRSFGMRCIGRSGGMTGIFINGLETCVSIAHFTF